MRAIVLGIFGVIFAVALGAAEAPPLPPRVSELRAEQQLLNRGYLDRASDCLQRARAAWEDGRNAIAAREAMSALVLLSRLPRRRDEHVPRIEEARTVFGLTASEDARRELRAGVAAITERYFVLLAQAEQLARKRAEAGDPQWSGLVRLAAEGKLDALDRRAEAAGVKPADVLPAVR